MSIHDGGAEARVDRNIVEACALENMSKFKGSGLLLHPQFLQVKRE
jgi:hypothetical protein